MLHVHVCAREAVERYGKRNVDYLISILADGIQAETPAWLMPERHLRFTFADVETESVSGGPTRNDMMRLIGFGNRVCSENADVTVLLHCAAGVSRSPAAAFILLAACLGPGREQDAMKKTAENCESRLIQPNILMVRYADSILERGGSMIRVVQDWRSRSFFNFFA